MPFTTLLLLLGLAGTISSSPVCPSPCKPAQKFERQYFKHISELGNSSVAPWTLTKRDENDEHLGTIKHAECHTCSVESMIAKPIYIQIAVFRRVRDGEGESWCRCPYELPVGCTCVKEK